MKYLHPEESLQSLIFLLVPSVLHRLTKFLRSATCSPGTFPWFRQTPATCPPLQAISSTPLDPPWWWWRLVVLVRPACSAQAESWDFFLSPSSGTSSQSFRRAKSQYLNIMARLPLLRVEDFSFSRPFLFLVRAVAREEMVEITCLGI